MTTARSSRIKRISDTEGGFTGVLDDGDFFGPSLSSLGDLDGDGVTDLAVGAQGDDDGGTGRGAVRVLFLDGVPPFVLLANENVEINGQVNSDGDIHANNDIIFNEGNKSQHAGNLTAMDDIIIKKKNKITGSATAGDDLDVQIGATITGTAKKNVPTVVFPLLAVIPLPTLPDFAHGDDDIEVDEDKTRTLAPGDYDEVKVEKGGKLKLSSGTYNLECLEMGEKSTLSIDLTSGLPIIINVEERVNFFKKMTMKLIPSTASTNLIRFNVDEDDDDGDNVVLIGEGS